MTVDPNNPGGSTIEEIQAHLADHPEDAQTVLAAEQARGDDARTTLVASLEGGATPQEGEPPPEGEEVTKPEDATIYPPGEYPADDGTKVPGTFGYESDAPGVQAGREHSQPEA